MNRSKLLITALALLVVTGQASAADKATPQKGSAAKEETSRPQAGSVLDVNQAELDASRTEALPDGVGLAGLAPVPERQERPMMLEIRAVLEHASEQSTQLQLQFETATNETTALGIQRELEKLMQDSEIEVLQIQARYARARGDNDMADGIEASIANILDPKVPVARTDRPRPSDNN